VSALVDFTGDEASAAVLARSLETLATEVEDAELGRRLRAVAAGRDDIRGLVDHPEMVEVLARGRAAFDRAWAALSPEEQEAELEAGNQALAEVRARLAP
jgi:hypothetical protein